MTEQFQKVFGEDSTFEFHDLVNDIIDRIEDGDVIQAIDDSLVYNVDRWEVVKHYENDPFNINVDEIIEQFIEEIEQFIEEIELKSIKVKEKPIDTLKNKEAYKDE